MQEQPKDTEPIETLTEPITITRVLRYLADKPEGTSIRVSCKSFFRMEALRVSAYRKRLELDLDSTISIERNISGYPHPAYSLTFTHGPKLPRNTIPPSDIVELSNHTKCDF